MVFDGNKFDLYALKQMLVIIHCEGTEMAAEFMGIALVFD